MPDDETYRQLLRDAAQFAATQRWVTRQTIQRHVRVGFVTAGRLVLDLQDAGLIGPAGYAGRHPVLDEPAALV
jgi:hypothetical protein